MLSLPKPRGTGDDKVDNLRIGDEYQGHSSSGDSELSIDAIDPEVGGETLERFLSAAAARGGPPGCGFVSLHTSLGDMCVELYWHHAPRTCLNFYLLAKRGYYDNTLFHRVCKGHWTQAGDPTGTGRGGTSIYGKPFKDEIHPGEQLVAITLVLQLLLAMATPYYNAPSFSLSGTNECLLRSEAYRGGCAVNGKLWPRHEYIPVSDFTWPCADIRRQKLHIWKDMQGDTNSKKALNGSDDKDG